MEINKSQLEQFIRTLQQTENQYFNNQTQTQNQNQKIINPKLNRLIDRKIKLINKLKYDTTSLVRLIEEIESEIKSPSKVKAVGI